MNLSGNAFFVRSNTPRAQAGLPIITAFPTVNQCHHHQTVSRGSHIRHQRPSLRSGYRRWMAGINQAALLVSVSPIQNHGINFYAGPWNYAAKLGGTATVQSASIPLPYGLPGSTGSRMFVSIRATESDGRLSDSQTIAVMWRHPNYAIIQEVRQTNDQVLYQVVMTLDRPTTGSITLTTDIGDATFSPDGIGRRLAGYAIRRWPLADASWSVSASACDPPLVPDQTGVIAGP